MSKKPIIISVEHPKCPYCNKDAVMVTGREIYGDKSHCDNQNFWVCWECGAYVGCHMRNLEFGLEGTEPLGTLANQRLRKARMKVHVMFDPLWEIAGWDRTRSYHWLAKRLGMSPQDCHIGNFNLRTCTKAIKALDGLRKILNLKDEKLEDTRAKKKKRKK